MGYGQEYIFLFPPAPPFSQYHLLGSHRSMIALPLFLCDSLCVCVCTYIHTGDFECLQCSFVYKPENAGQGALQGTQFDDLPSTWVCPVCKAPKVRERRGPHVLVRI